MEQTVKLKTTLKELLEAAAHFGHRTDRWNPKMKRFIFEERNGLYIIDLSKTMEQLRAAVQIVRKVVASKKSVLFVGTKKQAKGVIQEAAERCGEFYVSERWLGGMLTNLSTLRQSVKKLDRIEKEIGTEAEARTKKELAHMTKLQLKLERNLSGIRNMRKTPGLVIVVDPSKEHIAVAEARKLNIPVMALIDTNCDPDPIDYIIACNDDALKSIKLIVDELAEVIIDEKGKVKGSAKGEVKEGEEA
ncbi:MAG: 30S ribosomal protein S2 [Parachlamydiales bacterium]